MAKSGKINMDFYKLIFMNVNGMVGRNWIMDGRVWIVMMWGRLHWWISVSIHTIIYLWYADMHVSLLGYFIQVDPQVMFLSHSIYHPYCHTKKKHQQGKIIYKDQSHENLPVSRLRPLTFWRMVWQGLYLKKCIHWRTWIIWIWDIMN